MYSELLESGVTNYSLNSILSTKEDTKVVVSFYFDGPFNAFC